MAHLTDEHQHQHVHHAIEPVGETRFEGQVSMDKKDITEATHEVGSSSSPAESETKPRSRVRLDGWYSGYRVYWHGLFFMLATAWWVAGLVLHRPGNGKHKVYNWVIPFLLWLFFSLRLLTFHVSPQPLFNVIAKVWNTVFVGTLNKTVPTQYRGYAGAVLTAAVFLAGSMGSPESASNKRKDRAVSLFGMLVFVAVLFATSKDRRRINWKTVQVGLISQFIIALFVLRTGVGYDIFHFVSQLAVDLLGFAGNGFAFLFAAPSNFPYFVTAVLPAIIFFVSLVAIASHVGLLQWFIGKFALFFYWAMDVSGAEAVAASAAPFIGQAENAILISRFVPYLTRAELHQIMTSGFATIAGSVFGAYVGLGANPQVLLSSCIMSIPASIAFSKIRWPETEETLTSGKCIVPDAEDKQPNVLAAFTHGAMTGLRIAASIAGMLLCIIALVALIDGLLGWFGKYFQVPQLTIAFVLGYLLWPLAWLLGVPGYDCYKVAQLIGIKIIQNEFVAFLALTKSGGDYSNLSPRARLIAQMALAGFGNIGSVFNQIGVFAVIAPTRTKDVSQVAVSALLTGIMATLLSASIGGMVLDRDL
ncbi:hypothetical protein PYCC9005_005006 [Savitreella phatthalungensis]